MADRTQHPGSSHETDNRSRQLNPEHDAYWRSRGEEGRPADWRSPADPKPAKG